MIFPVLLRAVESDRFVSSPYNYRKAFQAAFVAGTPPKSSYYAFDVAILSRTQVEFVAYDMLDNFSGGIGKETWRGKANVPETLTEEAVEYAIQSAAVRRRASELFAAEAAIIDGYADEIRSSLQAAKP